MLMSPSQKVVVVSMGLSDGMSLDCQPGWSEGFMNSILWNVLSPAITPKIGDTVDSVATSSGVKSATSKDRVPRETDTDKDIDSLSKMKNQAVDSQDTVGSCMCDCPPRTGFGLCFNIDKSMGVGGVAPSDCNVTLDPSSAVAQMIHTGTAQVCPPMGHTMECSPGQTGSRCNQTSGDGSRCTQAQPCGPVPNMPPSFQVETCECGVQTQYFSPCVWSEASCSFGSYYPRWKGSQRHTQLNSISV